MSFTSIPFLILMLALMMAWDWARQGNNRRWVTICVFSFIFYGWWDWRFLFLLMGTGLIDFVAAYLMVRKPGWRRMLLCFSIVANIGSLVFFKYLSFGVEQLRYFLDIPDAQWGWTDSVILPIGISFYTFQSMSYTIDVYMGRMSAVRNPLHFFSYLSMFPQLVAGPIVRARDLLPQLETPGHFNKANRMAGVQQATWGFVKKLVIADNIAPVVNSIFGQVDVTPDAPLWWLAAILFAIQIFADFSGYSDIACGIARWLGYRYPENFRQPYAARSFREFWQRWHISLSTWFRDYVYIPLGGSRSGAARSNMNLMFTMLISGLWHGANWTFLAWGGLHGLFLLLERIPGVAYAGLSRFRQCLGWIITMVGVLVGWIFFRADSIGQAFDIIAAMFFGNWKLVGMIDAMDAGSGMALLLSLVFSGYWALQALRMVRRPEESSQLRRGTLVVVGILMAIFLRGQGDEFIYFQF
ncbi:MAG: hypothetical protein CMJ32_02440 [Phycisphaerae bacterium]|nr:hypothetical protein [Phycisphaerae bacterium]